VRGVGRKASHVDGGLLPVLGGVVSADTMSSEIGANFISRRRALKISSYLVSYLSSAGTQALSSVLEGFAQ
jgi:hypothetical protein